MITVISTGNNPPTRAKCIASVAEQVCAPFEHIVLDAATQAVPRGPMANLIETVHNLPYDRIVACVDLDDWLVDRNVLHRIEAWHNMGIWATYGSFKFADGRIPNWLGGYGKDEDVRTTQWRATHLKTFRAGLFKRIAQEDLEMGGKLIEHARDMATMFPILEMCGSRAVYYPDIIYVYNYANSTEFTGSAETLLEERRCVEHVRGLRRYQRRTTI